MKTSQSKLIGNPGRRVSNGKNKGFTIIEVMIVLAIAALILLVVFLAVPALQRSQRNNARKTDSSRVAAAVVEFTSNNSGNLPTTTADCTTVVTSVGTLAQYSFANPCTVAPSATMPASVTTGNLYIVNAGVTAAAPASQNGVMILVDGAVCNGATAVQTAGATAKNAALLYSIESGNTFTWACVNPQ